MAFDNGPKIVTNGLVLSLDAGDRNSYVSGSSTWVDMSGTGNNGTLTNGPTFSSANGGSIVFDGSDDYVNCGGSATINPLQLTYCAWVKGTAFTNAYNSVISRYERLNHVATLLIKSNNKLALYVECTGGVVNYDGTGLYTLSTSTWYHLCLTYNSISGLIGYINANIDGSAVQKGDLTTTSPQEVWIGAHPSISGRYLNGSVSCIQIYNKALSTSEILQNYNAQKSRFGL